MTTVRVRGIEKSFGRSPILRGVDLEVPDGSLTAVLGRSGSGKTTLLRLLAGFERPDKGTIMIDDEVVVDDEHFVAPEFRRIGFVPQEGALFPHLSIAENIGFGLRRGKAREGRIKEVLELIGLKDFGPRSPHELSGGQRQRVALGRALAPMPRLLLLDEPFSSLDAKMRSALRADVVDVLRQTKTTAVLVTHDQDEALSLADSVAVLRRGRVAQAGSPHAIYENPNDPDVAAFVGVANFVNGVRSPGGVRTPLGELELQEHRDAGSVNTGTEVVVLIRPEDLAIDSDASAGGLPARVEHVEYYGHDALIRLAMLEGDPEAFRAVFHGEQHPDAPEQDRIATLVMRSYDTDVVKEGSDVRVRCVGHVVIWPTASLDRLPGGRHGARQHRESSLTSQVKTAS